MKNRLSQKVIGGLVFGALLATSAGAAFASTSATTSTSQDNTKAKHMMVGQRENPLQTVLAKLVTDGTITQAKADAMKAFMAANKPADRQPGVEKKGMFTDLVQKGILTQAQQTKLAAAMQALRPTGPALHPWGGHDKNDTTTKPAINFEQMQTKRTAEMNTILAKLVADSTMTQATADAVTASMADNAKAMQQARANDTDKTKMQPNHASMLDAMVTKGIITEAEKTKIEAAVKAACPDIMNHAGNSASSKK